MTDGDKVIVGSIITSAFAVLAAVITAASTIWSAKIQAEKQEEATLNDKPDTSIIYVEESKPTSEERTNLDDKEPKAVSSFSEDVAQDETTDVAIVAETIPNVALGKPDYMWNFRESLNESNGLKCSIFGNSHIAELDDGIIRYALLLDGNGDYISCGNGLNMASQFTFNALINCQDVSREYSAFFAKYATNRKGPYAFSIRKGYVNCWITDNNGHDIEIESETKIEQGQWYYISVVRDDSKISLYIDGLLESEGAVNSVSQNEDIVTIGRQALLFDPANLQFVGYIAEISIYNQALSWEQIKSLAQNAFM